VVSLEILFHSLPPSFLQIPTSPMFYPIFYPISPFNQRRRGCGRMVMMIWEMVMMVKNERKNVKGKRVDSEDEEDVYETNDCGRQKNKVSGGKKTYTHSFYLFST
jgi:hypothetical protein